MGSEIHTPYSIILIYLYLIFVRVIIEGGRFHPLYLLLKTISAIEVLL